MKRVNTRLRPEQKEFIKEMAEEKNLTEGEVFRTIIDFYTNKNKQYVEELRRICSARCEDQGLDTAERDAEI